MGSCIKWPCDPVATEVPFAGKNLWHAYDGGETSGKSIKSLPQNCIFNYTGGLYDGMFLLSVTKPNSPKSPTSFIPLFRLRVSAFRFLETAFLGHLHL